MAVQHSVPGERGTEITFTLSVALVQEKAIPSVVSLTF